MLPDAGQVDALWMVSCEKWQHPNIQRLDLGCWNKNQDRKKEQARSSCAVNALHSTSHTTMSDYMMLL